MHQLAGMLAGIDEIAIADEEAANLASAILQVAGKRKKKIPPQALAWGNFITAGFAIYAPRAIAILAARKQRAAAPTLALVPRAAEAPVTGSQPN